MNRKYHTEIDTRLIQKLGVSNDRDVLTAGRRF